MQPKRFRGNSVRAVMAEVREVLGKDALILEQKNLGGSVEMLATVVREPDEDYASSQQHSDHDNPWQTFLPPSGGNNELYLCRLRSLGFSEAVLARLPNAIEGWEKLMPALLKQIPVADRLPASGLLTVTGPSGAGVTSSLIKYAVHLMRCGKDPRRIQFVQSGEARLGSDEALVLAGQMLGISVRRQSPGDAAKHLALAHPETLLLVDLSTPDPLPVRQLQLSDPLTPEQELLVIPAHWQSEVLKDWLRERDCASEGRHRTQCLVTNVDRCRIWGDWLSTLIERQWPLALLGTGPKLPDDLCQPRWEWLEQQLLEQIDRSRPATMVTAGETIIGH